MPEWIRDAVIKRFDERSIQSEKIHDMEMIRNRLLELEQEINSKLPEGDQELVHDWLDLYIRMTAVQNEWLYLKGIQDGMHILMYVQFDRH
ncbi:MAG: hypothetical protein WDZ91_09650 [Paenibacillaceae bacterium]